MQIPYVMVANLLFCSIFLPMTKISVESSGQVFKYWFLSSEYYVVVTFVGMFLTAICKIPQVTKKHLLYEIHVYTSKSYTTLAKTILQIPIHINYTIYHIHISMTLAYTIFWYCILMYIHHMYIPIPFPICQAYGQILNTDAYVRVL